MKFFWNLADDFPGFLLQMPDRRRRSIWLGYRDQHLQLTDAAGRPGYEELYTARTLLIGALTIPEEWKKHVRAVV